MQFSDEPWLAASTGDPNQVRSFPLTTNNLRRLATYLWCSLHPTDDERGASLVEYALLVALIAVVCIIAVTFIGSNASAKFSSVGNQLS